MTAEASGEPRWVGEDAASFLCADCGERRRSPRYKGHEWGKVVGPAVVPVCRYCVRARWHEWLRQNGYVALGDAGAL
jgi:hypothetical protein